jgi:Vault protein inter-alpha-trypsin domain/von Willebrand factor type A domain
MLASLARLPLAVVGSLLAALAGFAALQQEDLSTDTSVGRVTDREGSAARRPALADRWGPAEAGTRLAAGDWLRTGARGANALAIELAGGARLTLGPGGLLEVRDGARIALQDGELEVLPREHASVSVAGPGGASLEVRQRAIVRAHDGALTQLDAEPRWLTGYRSDTSSEGLGSLLCEIDGRNVPLTMGYHQVSVEVRDQIARTVIEESFENHTSAVLEGVFYFPLPADASISGFGMWIGSELVEGEIVEKERAREIYETILREKRDPGLLEWAGGNLFKARVYPIGAEKRIRISYTQVLPKQGDTYVYRYALQSDLLRQFPLRQLRIQVDVSSAEPLADVSCPTHACRIRTSEHASRVELEAQEYRPDRDFELAVRSAAAPGAVTLVPHRRGDDGYFMLLFTPPAAAARPSAQSEPLDVLVLADTSGSLWGAPRAAQMAFLETLLGALSERDTLDLATCDVETRWAFGKGQPCTAEARERALGFLEAREPLGWTDLDRAFRSACDRAGPRTHVIYVGDAAPTAGDPDPAAFAQRLARLYRGQGTFHAVVPGSSSESSVLEAIAALGGGSQRTLGSDPAAGAFELLQEITTPAVKDLELSFEGLDVAAVHPARLPNLPAGRQQIVLGRFDPRGGDLAGKVRVRGTLDGKPVELAADVRLAAKTTLDPEGEGNSFVPRLWARRRLDHLLAQGRSSEIRERILALSEQFQIVTPYTSFLVLESDADRQRFGVEKSVRMRDGEEFFAAGVEAGRHELVRQQMQIAKGWRRDLRKRALDALDDLGRELTELLQPQPIPFEGAWALGEVSVRSMPMGMAAAKSSMRGEDRGDFDQSLESKERAADELDSASAPGDAEDEGAEPESEPELAADVPASAAPMAREELAFEQLGYAGRQLDAKRARGLWSQTAVAANLDALVGSGGLLGRAGGAGPISRPYPSLRSAFPEIAPPPAPEAMPRWSPELLELVRSLDRRAALSSAAGGWSLEVETRATDARGRDHTATASHLLAADAWLQVGGQYPGHSQLVQWLWKGERGLWLEGWKLGRTRPVEPGDERGWYAPFEWHFGAELPAFADYEAQLEDLGDGRARLTLRAAASPQRSLALTIDRARAVVLEAAWTELGKPGTRQTFGAFQQVGGQWWPGQIESFDANGKRYAQSSVRVEALEGAMFDERTAAALELRNEALLLGPLPDDLIAAKQAALDGKATLEQRWSLLCHFSDSARWKLAEPHLAAFEEQAGGKVGLLWIRATYLQVARRREELRLHLLSLADLLAGAPRAAELDMAAQIADCAASTSSGRELRDLLVRLKPVLDRYPEDREAHAAWDQRVAQALQSMERPDELFAHRQAMALAYPEDVYVQTAYANELAQRGEVDAALAWLEASERDHGPWLEHEVHQLRWTSLDILWNSYRLEQVVPLCERWLSAPEASSMEDQVAQRYLSALVLLDREEEAARHVQEWLALASQPELSARERARLQAAVTHSLNGIWGSWRQARFEDREAELLANAARALARREDVGWLAGQILVDWRFRRTDAALAVHAELWRELDADLAELPPARIQVWVQWLTSLEWRPKGGSAEWDQLFERIYARWQAEGEKPGPLEQVIVANGPRELVLRHHRRLVERAAPGTREHVEAVRTLLTALVQSTWSQSAEDEAFQLLPSLSLEAPADASEAETNFAQRVLALYETVSWVVRERPVVQVAARPDANQLTRRELAAARKEARLEAYATLDARLAAESTDLEAWHVLERAWIGAKSAAREPDTDRMLRILTGLLETHAGHASETEIAKTDRVLALRCAASLTWALAHLPADRRAELESAWMELLEHGRATGSALLDWREVTSTVLLVLDRGEELERALDTWADSSKAMEGARWARARAHIAAERGDLERAAATLESAGEIDELTREDLRALGDWYTALDQPERARDARIRGWETVEEWQLNQLVQVDIQDQSRTGDEPPPELDPDVPLRLSALLRKAAEPQYQLWNLRQLYGATRDFRLLECVPEGVLGHTAQGIYGFLQASGELFALIQEEATIDRLQAHLEQLRAGERTDVDRRALFLLEFAMLRVAADQAQGTERHAAGALAALSAGRKIAWSEAEPGLMARFLAAQGRLRQEELTREQLSILRELLDAATNPDERLEVAVHFSSTEWVSDRREEAVRSLESALDARRTANDGRLPPQALPHVETLGSWLQELGSFRQAESMWLAELEAGHPETQRRWLVRQLLELERDAVLQRAELSIGAGDELYPTVIASFLRELARPADENHAREIIATLCDLWRRAHRELHLEAAPEDAVRFAFSELPAILQLYQHRNSQSIIQDVASCLDEVRGARSALEFLVVRAESEPRWLRIAGQDFWRQHGWQFAELRPRAGALGAELESRVLAVMVRELQEDLRSRETSHRSGYDQRHGNFWNEKRGAFLRAALGVLDERRSSGASVAYIAEYLFRGLSAHDEAAAVLLDAWRAKRLDLPGRRLLCEYLQELERWSESLPVVTEAIEDEPAAADLRGRLVRAVFHTQGVAAAHAALDLAEAALRERSAWNEEAVAILARAAAQSELHDPALELYAEAIALHTRTAPKRGVGDGVLSLYWREKAGVLARLGRTAQAVDAAAGAVVAWGSQQSGRAEELAQLRSVLASSEDLDGYLAQLDDEVATSGLENPILRKAAGQVLLDRRQFESAAKQLSAALAVQPDDAETGDLLITAFEGMRQPELAAVALLERARSAARDVELYARLGERYLALREPEAAERAFTSLVEAAPEETQGYERFARIRSEQRRFEEAADAWRQVVRIRSKEPTGYQGLAEALIRLERWNEAREVVRALLARPWPERFGDVHAQAEELLRRIPERP